MSKDSVGPADGEPRPRMFFVGSVESVVAGRRAFFLTVVKGSAAATTARLPALIGVRVVVLYHTYDMCHHTSSGKRTVMNLEWFFEEEAATCKHHLL